jgi:hypothetical protein
MAGTSEASMLLGREVNIVTYTAERLLARKDTGFLRSVLAGPKAWLLGSEQILPGVKEGSA